MRNLSAKVPEYIWSRIKPEIVAIRESADYDEGKRKLEAFLYKHGREIPTFCKSLADESNPAVFERKKRAETGLWRDVPGIREVAKGSGYPLGAGPMR